MRETTFNPANFSYDPSGDTSVPHFTIYVREQEPPRDSQQDNYSRDSDAWENGGSGASRDDRF